MTEEQEGKESDASFGTGNLSRSYSVSSLDNRNSEEGVSPVANLKRKETKISEMRRGDQYNPLSNMS